MNARFEEIKVTWSSFGYMIIICSLGSPCWDEGRRTRAPSDYHRDILAQISKGIRRLHHLERNWLDQQFVTRTDRLTYRFSRILFHLVSLLMLKLPSRRLVKRLKVSAKVFGSKRVTWWILSAAVPMASARISLPVLKMQISRKKRSKNIFGRTEGVLQ